MCPSTLKYFSGNCLHGRYPLLDIIIIVSLSHISNVSILRMVKAKPIACNNTLRLSDMKISLGNRILAPFGAHISDSF